MKSILLSITLVFLVTGCKKETPNFYKGDNQDIKSALNNSPSIKLQGVNIGPINKYGLIDDIFFMDNELLMLDVKSDSIFLKYNLKEGGVKKSIIKGVGPNEIATPQFLKITSFSNFSNDIQVYNYNKGLFKIDFVDQKTTSYFKLAKFDHKTSVQSIVMINKGIYAITSLDSQIKFSIYSDITKETKQIPLSKKNLEIVFPKDVFQSTTPVDIGYNRKHKIIFTWDGYFNSIDLHDENGFFIKSYTFGSNKNIVNGKFTPKYFYYYNVKSQGDYIYGIYAGFNTKDNFTESLIPHLKSEVHVFNIKTDEIKIYKLDRLINSCTIDFKKNIIYSIEENSESQPLVKYEMAQKN